MAEAFIKYATPCSCRDTPTPPHPPQKKAFLKNDGLRLCFNSSRNRTLMRINFNGLWGTGWSGFKSRPGRPSKVAGRLLDNKSCFKLRARNIVVDRPSLSVEMNIWTGYFSGRCCPVDTSITHLIECRVQGEAFSKEHLSTFAEN